MKNNLLILLSSVCLALSVSANAGAENFQFRHIGEKDGLGYTWINHISGDSRGYIWLATMYGAFRYDGFGFREYRFTSEDGKLLRVNVIFEDSSSMLWFGTEGGLFRHDPASGDDAHYSSAAGSLYRLSSDHVADICEDGNGNIWVAGPSGVDRIGRDGTMKSWKIGNVRTLMVDSRMNVWAGADSRPMMLDDSSGDFVPVSLPLSGLGTVTDLFQDSRNDIWISTVSGLVRYSLSRREATLYSTASGTLPNDLVRQTVEDRNGNVWAATEHGLVRFQDGAPESVLAEEGNLWGLNDNAIYSLHCDRDDNLWVGTFFGGLNVKYSHCGMFSFLLTYSEEFSASSRAVSSISHAGDELIVGTENDGVHIFSGTGAATSGSGAISEASSSFLRAAVRSAASEAGARALKNSLRTASTVCWKTVPATCGSAPDTAGSTAMTTPRALSAMPPATFRATFRCGTSTRTAWATSGSPATEGGYGSSPPPTATLLSRRPRPRSAHTSPSANFRTDA